MSQDRPWLRWVGGFLIPSPFLALLGWTVYLFPPVGWTAYFWGIGALLLLWGLMTLGRWCIRESFK